MTRRGRPGARRLTLAGTSALVATLAAIATTSTIGAPTASAAPAAVIVRTGGDLDQVATGIARLGGTVQRTLGIIDGLAVTIPSDRLGALGALHGVTSVTLDVPVRSMGTTTAADGASAALDTGSLSAISRIVGAQALWNAGYTGKGVDVAVIDTGISRVPGLDRAGKVVDGPDLSFDPHDPTVGGVDAFGHGTHMAGIIAGSDVAPTAPGSCTTCLGKSPYTDTTKFVGIAPEARLVNVKVGAFDGSADISQVIAAIDWVVQHRNDAGFNIRVINLSFGSDSAQSAMTDPLSQAAEVAWRNGIVVVAAAGNDGSAAPTLADPAYNPTILAVGASNPAGTLTPADDFVPDFAQHGTAQRGVDVVAPGVSVISLRVPGSFVDQNVTTGKIGTRFQRGSGTSQSTAVVSGLAALLLQKYPTATPDTIKAYLKLWADPINYLEAAGSGAGTSDGIRQGLAAMYTKLVSSFDPRYSGSGSANVTNAVATSGLWPSVQWTAKATGRGTLEGARGSFHVVSNGVALTGEVDVMGNPWSATEMAAATAKAQTWSGGTWNGARWSGEAWSGARWSSVAWSGNDWSGARWSGARWSGARWSSGKWSGARWSGARWSDAGWDGARWSGARWSDAGWG